MASLKAGVSVGVAGVNVAIVGPQVDRDEGYSSDCSNGDRAD